MLQTKMKRAAKKIEEEHWSKLLESVVINTTDGVLIQIPMLIQGSISSM